LRKRFVFLSRFGCYNLDYLSCHLKGRKKPAVTDDLLQAIEASDSARASSQFKEKLGKGADAWDIHLSLFPAVQRVLNPPFINPHLPKMYRICRDFIPYLTKEDIPSLIQLEIAEYATRPKMDKLPKWRGLASSISFGEVELAIHQRDLEKTATLIATFYTQKGGTEFARRLLLLGSGYLDDSLGHSISCTAPILLEMIERQDQDPWPALTTLADYFCKGTFHTTPRLRKLAPFASEDAIKHHLMRATSGTGIINLHHTITVYTMEQVRHFFNKEEYDHLVAAWIAFMGKKKGGETKWDLPEAGPAADYSKFYEIFSRLETKPVIALVKGMMASEQSRRRAGRFLIKGVCDLYQGNYNPHYLTGLGSALWVMKKYWDQSPMVINALFQFLDFFLKGVKP
jgi:hypothetical protein